MSRICAITGKRPIRGSSITRKGQSIKSGGIGTHVVKVTTRRFRPNVQRVRALMPSGEVRRIWVSVKALKAGKIVKAP
ncbi:MAG: 50S ribosomal protein L28 [Puniceicoccales bacterium]|jgi:large subunit ribosomal protein L28|nr:50S ribosomal protein L28 [Puniceicoccales bacterium]